MKIQFIHNDTKYQTDLSQGINISIPLKSDGKGPKCFYAPDFKIEPVVAGDFVGSTDYGSPVNFKNLFINPHGNGTHTECVGHITSAPFTIHDCLKKFHFVAQVLSLTPDILANGDLVITKDLLSEKINLGTEALIIRTLPNNENKLSKDYSGTNPPYFSQDAIAFINQMGILHLMTDLPSIDREEDGGALAGHKTFWGYPSFHGKDKTITELVFVSDDVLDGSYFCNIQVAPIESDASPSKIVLYEMKPTD